MGIIEGNISASDNDWEAIKKGGDAAIQRWIDGQLVGRTCSIVLIGANTSGRKWINYEIEKSWNDGIGLVGIHIHRLKDFSSLQSTKGSNPFATFTMKRDNSSLSSIVKTYDPPYWDSKDVYKYIKDSLGGWIEEAIKIRDNY
jgi:hypothetical protein